DRSLIDSLDIPGENLEGYLFPETYHFDKNTDERAIVKTMVDTFKRRALKPEYLDRARELGFSFHKIITLASLIEKETGREDERELISAVFHNRLRKNMRLQCDPTVIYALKNFDGNLRKKDLGIDSPYNTYRYAGLPPGPIANPGLESIRAALYPASANYIYFVSKQNGSHEFSSALADHNRAVRKYQLKKSGRS
ncbi:MAG: endolytic transglycosylase MltG, partial [Nitrospinales bacterium]